MENLPVVTLSAADLSECTRLAVSREWGAEEAKWRFLFEVGTVFGIRHPVDGVIGTVVLTWFGARDAGISMVLVAEAHAGRGYGRRLMEHAMAAAGDATLSLYATDIGRPLYSKLGFAVDFVNTMHRGRFTGAASGVSSLDFALDEVLELDRVVTGVDRSAVLRAYVGFASRVRVLRRAGEVVGYAGMWRNDTDDVIGPVVAPSSDDACALIGDLAAESGLTVRVEVHEKHVELGRWAEASGLSVVGQTSFMVFGGRVMPGDRGRWFGPIMQALG
ncbi:GNAT family N-acetyltransferase [Herbihabitans rhizosphaerae]|uniref:GNAT family N-acetyltransferase n=1 Tax=Herbihabitans rhizosphaerae TaxID=1872711 RepID=UPI0013EE8B96|nr:GNAT family N-acetyltransferase [Herbihabitans rhizosphaerae]